MTVTRSRKALGLLGASIAVLSLPVLAATPASAAAGAPGVFANNTPKADELTLVGKGTFSKSDDLYYSNWQKSGGGKFAACMTSPKPNGGDVYAVYEYDKGSNKDERVGYATLTESQYCAQTNKASDFIDGSNKRAEFYVATLDGRAKNMNVSFYD